MVLLIFQVDTIDKMTTGFEFCMKKGTINEPWRGRSMYLPTSDAASFFRESIRGPDNIKSKTPHCWFIVEVKNAT